MDRLFAEFPPHFSPYWSQWHSCKGYCKEEKDVFLFFTLLGEEDV